MDQVSEIDDNRNDSPDGLQILRILRDQAFESSDEKLAVALGRPTEEIEAWFNESVPVDEDAVMKARGIAMQRGIQPE